MSRGPRYRAATPEQRRLAICGVPSRYWHVTPIDTISQQIRSFTVERPWAAYGKPLQVSAQRQRTVLNTLFGDEPWDECAMVIGIGSGPTDELAMTVGAEIVRSALSQNLKVRMRDLGAEGPRDYNGQPHVLLLHNVHAASHAMRLQVCRDWLVHRDDTMRVVLCAGNPVEFFQRHLRYPIDTALYLEGDAGAQNLQY
jgi:hypothetical protein